MNNAVFRFASRRSSEYKMTDEQIDKLVQQIINGRTIVAFDNQDASYIINLDNVEELSVTTVNE